MAERSKAPDLSSGTRMSAWVRTPLLTKPFFPTVCRFIFFENCVVECKSGNYLLEQFLLGLLWLNHSSNAEFVYQANFIIPAHIHIWKAFKIF